MKVFFQHFTRLKVAKTLAILWDLPIFKKFLHRPLAMDTLHSLIYIYISLKSLHRGLKIQGQVANQKYLKVHSQPQLFVACSSLTNRLTMKHGNADLCSHIAVALIML